jgi:DNA-binding LytR/AlgR family response regulator
MLIRCLIADDEPMARKVLANYVARMPQLELFRACTNALDVQQILATEPIDLLFLDIKMPQMTGIELLRNLETLSAKVIFTTAYTEHAFESYELGVADYLRKPFSFDRFKTAVERAFPELATPQLQVETEKERTYLFLKVERSMQRVSINQILYIQGYGNYIKVFTTEGMLLAYERMSDLEHLLPTIQFVRVHKSWIVALNQVTRFQSHTLHIGEVEIPVGEAKRGVMAEAWGKKGYLN